MGIPRRPALPRRTVRQRFTALYGALFLLSGAGLLTIAYLVTSGSMSSSRSAPFQNPPRPQSSLAAAQEHIARLQEQLSRQQTAQSRQLLLGSVVALAVMAVVSVVLGRIVAGRVLRPLRMMTTATRRISADNLHERLAVPGPADEVKDLADTIDGLLERLEGAFTAQRRFVANASHELRTPLTTMRASLDVAVAKPEPVPPQTIALADRLRTELDQVDRLLDGFLMLARTQHGALPEPATLSLGSVVSAALASRAADIGARDLTVHDAIRHDGALVRGSRTLLGRMVDNVIDNAIGHNHDGGWIRVAAGTEGATASLVVETGGQVLDQRQVAQLAQPFRRLGADRTNAGDGAGLGLSIVAAIATAHGGTLDLRARPEGGLLVGISLPLAAHPVAGPGRAGAQA
ncbi:sensor histidine kinase [Actinomadura sp. HBU206391]|uniref:HAMP domain-containing sensor histidine kinase n=1 Tax=Actinomadura sp. HBU206391 TaxID=2731692 RepID=UPI00164EF3D9|nr:HAMP domain-containing sensor histidine kinase [Actinomadura sp. HBU206391]MBC6456440.1 HAMP domain-containing histidine kinase [Actinomadura sp. HBU206391]